MPRTYVEYTGGQSVIRKTDEQPKAYDRAGYWEDTAEGRIFLFTKDGLREATRGYDFNRVLRALDEAGAFYVKGYGKEKAKKRDLPDGGQAKLYHINPKKLEPDIP
jgi:putative DNA primase/helicase